MINSQQYYRFVELGSRINGNIASLPEKDEYMQLSLEAGYIKHEQYQDYVRQRQTVVNNSNGWEGILRTALIVGALGAVAYYISKESQNTVKGPKGLTSFGSMQTNG